MPPRRWRHRCRLLPPLTIEKAILRPSGEKRGAKLIASPSTSSGVGPIPRREANVRRSADEADEGDPTVAPWATGAASAPWSRPGQIAWLTPSLSMIAMRSCGRFRCRSSRHRRCACRRCPARRSGLIGEARAAVGCAAPVVGVRRRSPCGRARGLCPRRRRSSRRPGVRRVAPGRSRSCRPLAPWRATSESRSGDLRGRNRSPSDRAERHDSAVDEGRRDQLEACHAMARSSWDCRPSCRPACERRNGDHRHRLTGLLRAEPSRADKAEMLIDGSSDQGSRCC